MKTITSRTNEEIKEVCLLHAPKGRKEKNQFIAEGERICSTLVKKGMKIVQLYVTDEHTAWAQKLVNEKVITIVHETVMQKISTASTPSGILGVFEIPAQPHFSELKPGLVLAQIADPGNMGTLIRTAAALNIPNVIVIEGTDVWSPKVIQACAGTIAQVKIFDTTWESLIKWKKDLRIGALVVKGGKKPSELDCKNMLLVVGNEAHGIQKEWLRDADDFVTIPMPGNIESLNAAVAGSIALYLAFGTQDF